MIEVIVTIIPNTLPVLIVESHHHTVLVPLVVGCAVAAAVAQSLARIIALVVMVRGIININILLVQIIHVIIIMILVILRMIVENIMIHQWMSDLEDVQIYAINGKNSELRHRPLLFRYRH